jgi:tetratricopeptide (TPR) repeat protein
MLADAYQRRAGTIWYFIVLIPFGEWVYFFKIKIHDPEVQRLTKNLIRKKVSLKQIKYNAESTPSTHNKLLYAQALHDHQLFKEAITVFQDLLKRNSDDKKALYGLGLCLLKLDRYEDAIQPLESLIEQDFTYDQHSAAADLARCYWGLGEREKAIQLLESVLKKSQRIAFKSELARYLRDNSDAKRANEVVQEAIMDYQNSPAYIRRSDRAWYYMLKKQAKQLAKQ